jgi:hypothetical protein
MAQLFIAALEVVVHVWDFISYPISLIIWRPWLKLKSRDSARSRVKFSKDEIEFQSLPITCQNRENVLRSPQKIDTVDKLFNRALEIYGPNACLGTRRVLRFLKVEQTEDIVLNKLDLVRTLNKLRNN